MRFSDPRLNDEIRLVSPNLDARMRLVLAYPNTYAVAMSNLGVHTLYRLFNLHPEVCCERAFLPSPEPGERRGSGHGRGGADSRSSPLTSLESGRPIADADLLAISASFENDYPNLLRLLDLARLPLRAASRDATHPLVVMGGATVSINPEPVAAFVDIFCLGEGEKLAGPLIDAALTACSRDAMLEQLAQEPGFYVPKFYRARYSSERAGSEQRRTSVQGGAHAAIDDDKQERGTQRFAALEPDPLYSPGAPPTVTKVRTRFGGAHGPDHIAATSILTPHTEFGDRATIEVARGCTKGCRYCWVGYNVLPFRVHPVDDVLAVADRWREHTSRIGLVATALLDHPDIEAIAAGLRRMGFGVFSPSLIISTLRETLLNAVIESGQRTITIAPETGSDRMRELIMKKITNDEILEKVRMIFRAGAVNLKNYIIIGLPGERKADLQAIVDLARDMRTIMLDECRSRGRIGTITLSINCLIPKPSTPMQWAPQIPAREYRAKLRWLRRALGGLPNVIIDAMRPRDAEMQAVLSRGDRRTADLLETWHRGGSFRAAMRDWKAAGGLGLEAHLRALSPVAPLPWGHLRTGPSDAALTNQWMRASAIAQREDSAGESREVEVPAGLLRNPTASSAAQLAGGSDAGRREPDRSAT